MQVYFELDGRGPRYTQLVRALKFAVLDGRIAAGSRLPATRELAVELGLSRNTVLEAYDQLRAEGFISARVGAGSFVADLPIGRDVRELQRPAQVAPPSRLARRVRDFRAPDRTPPPRYDLRYGVTRAHPTLSNAWRRELAHAAVYTGLQYPDPAGLPALRSAVCDYLARRRGVLAEPDDVLIVSGSQQAFSLGADVLLDEGDAVVLEEPGYFGARWVVRARGARPVPVPVDDEGLVCDALPREAPKLVCVTPSHQFPGGSVLSLSRRLELLRYADRHRCWILEDDYDGEFRYDVAPLAALRSLDRADRVLYVGTFSKVLFPALRLGYMIVPEALRADFIACKRLTDLGCSAIEQSALARFMRSGGFERHLRMAARSLAQRRAELLSGLDRHVGDRIEIAGACAGTHVVGWMRDFSRQQLDALIAAARERGLGLHSLAPHFAEPPTRQGLLLGYGGLSVAEIRSATQVFGACLNALHV